MAHDTLLGCHKEVLKTQDRVTSEFYWPGIHDDILRYCWSCDVCQRNVSKKSVGGAHLEQMPLVETPYSTICVDLVGPLSPPSEGHRFILTVIDLCTRVQKSITVKMNRCPSDGGDNGQTKSTQIVEYGVSTSGI